MRGDAHVPGARIGGQKRRDSGRGPPGAGALVEAVGNGPGAEGVAGHGVGEGGVELAGVVPVEQAEQEGRVVGQALAAPGEGVEEGGRMRAGVAEAIAAAQVLGAAFGGGEAGQVGLGLDALAAVVGAGVARDLRRSIQGCAPDVPRPRA
jgi:hypothetical protein